MNNTDQRTRPQKRQASILVCVLACMAVATALVVATTRSALQSRREVRKQLDLRQIEFVLGAGIQRAVGQLAADAQYGGETWTLSKSAVGDLDSAQVEIEVSSRTVRVIARSPATGLTVVQRSHAFPIDRVISLSKE